MRACASSSSVSALPNRNQIALSCMTGSWIFSTTILGSSLGLQALWRVLTFDANAACAVENDIWRPFFAWYFRFPFEANEPHVKPRFETGIFASSNFDRLRYRMRALRNNVRKLLSERNRKVADGGGQ